MRKIPPPQKKKNMQKDVPAAKSICESSLIKVCDLVNGKILRNHMANRHNCRSEQSPKAIVQVEVEAIAKVMVNAWPFQWRQVDT